MKRSEINKALRELEAMCQKYHGYLPAFCHVTHEDWQNRGHAYDEAPYRLLCTEYPEVKA